MERVGSRQMYRNTWMTLREDAVRRADGSEGVYGVVDKPDYALIIPLEDDRLQLVQQFRYPLGLRRWEFPQGTAPDHPDIPSTELAARELREETGLVAESLTDIGLLDVAPGFSSQRGRVFVATRLTQKTPRREPEEQDMCAEWFERSRFEEMTRSGEITDAQTVAAYTLLLLSERTSTDV